MSLSNIKNIQDDIIVIGYAVNFQLNNFLDLFFKPYQYVEVNEIKDIDYLVSLKEKGKRYVIDLSEYTIPNDGKDVLIHKSQHFNRLFNNQFHTLKQNNIVIICNHMYYTYQSKFEITGGSSFLYAPSTVFKILTTKYNHIFNVEVTKDRYSLFDRKYDVHVPIEERKAKIRRILKYD